MSIRLLNRTVKPLAKKGTPGAVCRRITVRFNAEGKKQQFHPTKGWRRLV